MDKAKQIKDLEDLHKAEGISYAGLKSGCMEIMQNEEVERKLQIEKDFEPLINHFQD